MVCEIFEQSGKSDYTGKRLGVIGTINMNLAMIDLTECPEAQHGDEVVLIGEQGQNTISVSSFAELSDLLNYELLTRLPANTPRRIVNRKILKYLF